MSQLKSVRKGSHDMNTMCPEQSLAAMAPSVEESRQEQPGNFLYQAATVIAILLFLISF